MAGKIFISYRRDDSIGTAGRLRDRLAETFGGDNVFMDVDSIPVGINFEKYVESQVAACDAVLSVIGPNWLNAKDETDQRRLDKSDDFVVIEIAAALARDILVIPVLVDGTRMPKASELPASLKPLALRNAIHLRNTNFGSDAEQLITRMRGALALGRPERTQELVLLWFNTHLVAAFLLNISVFLIALGFFFSLSGNNAGALAAMVAAAPISLVGWRTLARDESVRMFGFVIAVGGLLAVAAILVSPRFFRVGLFESPTIQSGSLAMGAYFMMSAQVFGLWKKIVAYSWMPSLNKMTMKMANSAWLTGFTFLSPMLGVVATWEILYRLTDSVAAAFALVGVQLLVVSYCYVGFRKALGAPNPAAAR
ncbi:MAG TPA: toll/interleukin-1 receptor domain-containing protein [Xanthobacteraceae bacterium]|jgi:hypothetical protein